MKTFKIILIIIILLFCACGAGFYYLVGTAPGAACVLNQALSRTDYVQSYGFKKVEGSLLKGVTVEHLVLKGLQKLPPESECHIAGVRLSLASLFPPFEPRLVLTEGRLSLQGSEPIFFSGIYTDSTVEAEVTAQRVNIESLRDFLTQYGSEVESVSGSLIAADMDIVGPVDELQLEGTLTIEECRYRLFQLQAIPLVFDLVFKKQGSEDLLFGTVTINDGIFSGAKTAALRLRKSTIRFNGDPNQGVLDITAGATIDEVAITARLEGVMENPEFSLSSEPSLSREELLLILATGHTWRNVLDSVKQGGGIVDKLKEFFTYEEQYINH